MIIIADVLRKGLPITFIGDLLQSFLVRVIQIVLGLIICAVPVLVISPDFRRTGECQRGRSSPFPVPIGLVRTP